MPRPGVSVDLLAAFQSGDMFPILFVQITFTNETVYLWNGLGNIAWNGQTWSGAGDLLSLSGIEEVATVESRGASFSLSGFNAAMVTEFLNDFQIGLPAIIYLGAFYPGSPNNIIPTPVAAYSGRMDQPVIEASGETATITVAVENRLVDMNTSVERRYTNEDQQSDHPGDLAFQFVNALQDQNSYWGRTPSSSNNV